MSQRAASWIIVSKETGEAVMETFTRKVVEGVNTAKYTALPVREYLAGLNAKLAGERANAMETRL